MDEQQVKSKQRVADHGEVFTAEREVKAMCDLVKSETERIDSRFLEPACGNGNFLAEVLRRKLSVVRKRYARSIFDYERYSVVAVTSIYGVDILEDNAQECRERMFDIWNTEYTAVAGRRTDEHCREAVRFILRKNILCGDALTMRQNNGDPIVFSEWSLVVGSHIKRRDFTLVELLNPDELSIQTNERETKYVLTDFRKVQDYE